MSQSEVNNETNEEMGEEEVRVRDLGRIIRQEPPKPPRTPSPPKFREDLGGGEIVRDLDQHRPRWEPKPKSIGRGMKAVSDASMLTSRRPRNLEATTSSRSLAPRHQNVRSPTNEKQALLMTSPDAESSCYVNVEESDGELDEEAHARETLPLRGDDVTVERSQRPSSLMLERVHKVNLDVNKY